MKTIFKNFISIINQSYNYFSAVARAVIVITVITVLYENDIINQLPIINKYIILISLNIYVLYPLFKNTCLTIIGLFRKDVIEK